MGQTEAVGCPEPAGERAGRWVCARVALWSRILPHPDRPGEGGTEFYHIFLAFQFNSQVVLYLTLQDLEEQKRTKYKINGTLYHRHTDLEEQKRTVLNTK